MKGIERKLQALCSDEPRVIRSLLVVSSERRRGVDEELKLPREMVPNLGSLRALDLTSLRIYELPDSMGYLRHLHYLSLGVTSIRRLPETIGKLYNLQVLNLEACFEMKSLPESIGGLCNLRYLNLNSCERLRSLPESIGDLWNLRYLNLNDCVNLMSLPESIKGLCNLQCLEIEMEDRYFSYPKGMSRLTNLRSLVGFTVASRRRGSGEVHEMKLLKDMVYLRDLQIYGLANVVNPEDAMAANLRNKEHIKQLRLYWSGGNGDNDDDNAMAYCVLENLRLPNGLEELEIYNYKGIRFPSWMGGDASSFSRLTRVELNECSRCTLLPSLGQLPLLKHLEIWHANNVERVGPEFRGVGFPALEVLHFHFMSSWVTWDAAEREDFPRLRKLHVSNCPKLQSMVPVYFFPALQELKIEDCGSLPSIELKMPSSSSSSSSSMGPPPLVEMLISWCPLARFSPEDDPLLLPATLQYFNIYHGCPLLLEWCLRDNGGRRLAHIPLVDMFELKTGDSDSCSESSSSCDET